MDDLLDLSWSDPSTPATGSNGRPLGAGTGSGHGSGQSSLTGSGVLQPLPARRAGSALSFDTLAKPGAAGGPNYASLSSTRTSSPLGAAGAGARPSSGLNSPLGGGLGSSGARASGAASPASRTGASPAPRSAASGGGDAFSSLLGLGGSAVPSSSKTMSMADRARQLEAERKARLEEERGRWDHGDFWDKQLGGGNSEPPAAAPVLAPVPKAPASAASLDRVVRSTPSPAPASTAKSSGAGTFWDSPALQPTSSARASPAPAPAAHTQKSSGFDDLDDLLKPTTSSIPNTLPSSASAPADPWDLDALSVSVSATAPSYDLADSDDDVLGDLGRPAKPKTPASRQSPAHSSPNRASPPARVDSPPPHIVGQIVEMGFSPAQARAALAATPTGLDVQAALESLLNGQVSGGGDDDHRHERDSFEMDDERIAREMQAREEEKAARRAARRAGSSRDPGRAGASAGEQRQRPGGPEMGPPGSTDEFAEQADRIMAQASEIGASMLSKATSFWNTGKERAMKVYEEQRRALDAQNAPKRRPADGRPRWMIEAEEAAATESTGASGSRATKHEGNGFSGGFRDEDMPPSPPPAARPRPAAKPAPGPAPPSNASRIDSLFSDEPRRPYISKNRHPKGRGAPAASSSPAPAPTPRRAATPPPSRQLVPASPSQISTAAQHKTKGNEHFKLGRYAEADAAYGAAIASLPSGHIQLVPLHNNRAAARLKLGEGTTAAADCTVAIELIGPAYHPSKEAPLPPDVDVKLGDALIKAMTKRAQAHEMGEKWQLALQDWERVLGFDAALAPGGAGSKALASEGVRRAKRMLEGGGAPAASPKPTTRAAPPRPAAPPKPVDVSRSAAVSEMRAAAAQAEKEDDERASLKDGVDARIESWKKGKETNLRALLASLDSVLWDAILAGGLKVGMHELVTDKQVKIKYMRVVARLHPDKLQAGATTVEQRMLASAVFGVLSEAWAAFNA